MIATSSSVALLHYTTRNLGDDIQTFAVRQFIDTHASVDRDRLHDDSVQRELVLYGWLLHGRQWPPLASQHVHPLSIHVAPRSRPIVKRHIDWWRPLGIIPCRDSSTAAFFLSQSIPALFEGCVSLSLNRWVQRQPGCVVVVDVASNAGPQIEFSEVLRRTHTLKQVEQADQEYRQAAARAALETYQRAEMVVTSRLHVMLPCLAFGTPVLYVPSRKPPRASDYTRMLDYLPYVETWDGQQSYASGSRLPVNYRPTALIERVTARLGALASDLKTYHSPLTASHSSPQ